MSNLKVFELVLEIQKDRPNWRFSLLGGDLPRDFKRNKLGDITGYKKTRSPFGWQAEFFTLKNGDRIQSGGFIDPKDAIIVAVAKARKAIKEGLE